jgi:nicotinamidase-related amidase
MISIDPAKAALVLMDFQNYGVHSEGYWAIRDPEVFARIERSGTVVHAARALDAARAAGMRIVHVVNRWRPGHIDMDERMPMWLGRKGTDVAVEGTWGAEIVDALAPLPDEPVVVKRSISALAGTELARLLTLYGIDTLVLGGVATNFVVEGTAREAADLGYGIVVLSDACETMTDEWQRLSLEIMSMLGAVMTVEEFGEIVGAASGTV